MKCPSCLKFPKRIGKNWKLYLIIQKTNYIQIKHLVFYTFIGIWFLSGCCKDKCQDPANPDCSNYDPCYGTSETIASFKIYDILRSKEPSGWEWQDTDTVSLGAVFEADIPSKADGCIAYEWQIGAEKYYTRWVNMDDFPLNSTMSVKLTVRNSKPNTNCYPNDKGIATAERSFYTSPNYNRLNGIYRGSYSSRPLDSIDFLFHVDSNYSSLPFQRCRSYYGISWLNNGTITLDWESPKIKDQKDSCFLNFIRSTFNLSKDSKNFKLKFFKRPNSSDTLLTGRKLKSI